MVSHNVSFSPGRVRCFLMIAFLLLLFGACNKKPCEQYVGYAPRYFDDLGKFVWTACADPNITFSACEYQDIDKSRYLILERTPSNTYKVIRGPYPGVETQYVEQAGGEYFFVNKDDFIRQSSPAANSGEFNYFGPGPHTFAGTAIMADYRYTNARADAISHAPCGMATYDCMGADFKAMLGECTYSEDEPNTETGYVPYIFDRTFCTPGDNFRVASGNLLTIENCEGIYYIDTKNNRDQTGPTTGNRIIYMGVNIDPFDPTKKYALYVNDGTDIIYKCELGYYNGDGLRHIIEKDPKREPNKPAPVTFTVRAELYLNTPALTNAAERHYTVSVKYFTDNIDAPTGPVPGIISDDFSLKNRYPYQAVQYKERVMSIQLLGNVGTSFSSNLKDYGFATTFTNTWTNSEVHAIPNYLPSAYTPSVSASGTPNATPGNLVLPEYLIDKDGNVVILDTDIDVADQTSADQAYTDVMNEWNRRFESYMSHITNEPQTVNTLAKLLETVDLALQPSYQNKVSAVLISGVKVYEYDVANGGLKRDPTTNVLQPDITATKKLPGNVTVTSYRTTTQLAEMGVTIALKSNAFYHPVIIVDRGMIARFASSSDINSKIMATAMHEMAHAWYNTRATDPSLDDGTMAGGAKSHAAYCRGKYSEYCLMRYCPAGKEDQLPLTLSEVQAFIKKQAAQMQFSVGVQQRLANVMSFTYENEN